MTTYILTFRNPPNYRPTPESAAVWRAWHLHLGAHLKDRGNPVFRTATLGTAAGGSTLGGYSLIRAASLEAAVSLASGCPALGQGGCVEVGEVTNVDESYDTWLAGFEPTT